MISPVAVIDDRVSYGKDCRFEDFVIVGKHTSTSEGALTATNLGAGCIIRSHSVIYAGNAIGDGFVTGHHVVVRDNNRIGHNVSLGSLSIVEHHVIIGNDVRIHSQAFIPEFCELATGAWIGPGVRLTNAKYPNSTHSKDNLTGVYIGENAVIGANSVILPGVRIKERALVGAGAVVTKDVSAESVVGGNPAKIIGTINDLPSQGGQDERLYG